MIGLISLNKPSGMSSSNAVVKIKHLAHQKRVGHMGTLDPLASGVLIIGVGKATRLFDYYLNKTKTYIARFEFGKLTDTLDIEGQVLKENLTIPTKEEIEKIIPNLVGKISQMPPIFSAKSIGGVKAYKLARQGIEVNLQPKEVTINYIKLLGKVSNTEYEFEIDCSSGTYIRSIARDMGRLLNTEAIMSALVRTRCGPFCIADSVSLDTLTEDNIEQNLVPLDIALKDLKVINLNDIDAAKIINGISIFIEENNSEVCVVNNSQVLGIGSIQNNKLKIINYLKE